MGNVLMSILQCFLLPNYIKSCLAFTICPLSTSLGGREVKMGLVSSCPIFGNGGERGKSSQQNNLIAGKLILYSYNSWWLLSFLILQKTYILRKKPWAFPLPPISLAVGLRCVRLQLPQLSHTPRAKDLQMGCWQ